MIFIFFLLSCGPTYLITSDCEKEIDFSTYHTYKVRQHQKDFRIGINPINQQRIERALNREMKRLQYQVSDNPDLLVSYFVKIERIQEINPYGPYYRQWQYPHWYKVNEYEEGTLVIDLIDPQKNIVVWHGAVSGRVYRNMEKVEEKINRVVKELMDTYAKDSQQHQKEMVRL